MYTIFQRVYKRTLMFLSGRTSGRATLNAVERVLLVAAERNANGSVLGRLLRRADAGAGRARRDGVRRAAVVGYAVGSLYLVRPRPPPAGFPGALRARRPPLK